MWMQRQGVDSSLDELIALACISHIVLLFSRQYVIIQNTA